MCRFVLRGYNYHSAEPKCHQNSDSSTEGNFTSLAQEHLIAGLHSDNKLSDLGSSLKGF